MGMSEIPRFDYKVIDLKFGGQSRLLSLLRCLPAIHHPSTELRVSQLLTNIVYDFEMDQKKKSMCVSSGSFVQVVSSPYGLRAILQSL